MTATLDYAYSAPPPSGEILEIAPGVCWARFPLPFALDHINIWLLEDGDGWTVVDTGFPNDVTRACWEGLLAGDLGGRPVKRVVVTHMHPDHLGCAHWLQHRFGAPVWMTAGDFMCAGASHAGLDAFDPARLVDLYRLHGMDDTTLGEIRARGNAYRRAIPQLPDTYCRLMDGDVMKVGGRSWQVIEGYGHSPAHASLYCRELNLLISGDMLLPRISTNISVWPSEPEADPLRLFLSSVESFRTLPANTLVLPSHGLPFRGIEARIDQLQAHHLARLGELLTACATPRTATELIPVLFTRALDTHQMVFAIGETIAHLNYCWHRGEVVRSEGADGVLRFVRG